MTKPRPVRWLHLSDLHLGCRGKEVWWQAHEEFEASVREKTRELGAPDLLLFTGDLTFSGQPEQFKQVDDFLDALLGWIRKEVPEGTPEPLLITVPGNHDLQRPEPSFPYQFLDTYHEPDSPARRQLDETLWGRKGKKPDASHIDPLFSAYQRWFKRKVLPDLKKRAQVTDSHFPGDVSLEIDVGGFPLAIVGLNSTWQQYTGEDFERRLVIPTQQFHSALRSKATGTPLAIFTRCKRSLLLMHHPPSWLAPRGQKMFDEEIYPSERFDACLYGHMHQGRSTETAIQGGKPRCFFQSPSLFGLEHYGTSEEERAIGYSWGELSPKGVVKVWPLQRAQQGGKGAFVDDPGFPRETDGGSIIGGGWERKTTVPTAPPVDLNSYLRDLIDHTNHIAISGIASSRARGAHRYPIESLYTPLSSRLGLEGTGGETAGAALLRGERSVGLAELLPKHDRLLIEGQPGAGKTTFLRLVACMLGRDLVGDPCPGGGTWRSRHLGLPADEAPRVPVLLRVSELVALLLDTKAPKHRKDNRLWLLDLLERSSQDNDHEVPRAHWQELLEEGRAVLLLDGLDEAADEKVRTRIFEIFRDACKKWRRCPVVVSSRPLQTEPLREMGFHHATIEPFGDKEIRTFLDHWVTALHTTETGTPGREAKRYEEALAEAIFDRPRVRRLATNPVMLTSLCVVHWNEGRRLPEGRSRVYRAVIKWLLAARSTQRQEAGFTDRFAERALARVALSMMSGPEGKRAVVDLAEGAKAVMPLLVREMPEASSEDRRHRARDWLAFECLGSGIVEELPGRQIRFWHLTFQEFLAAQQLAWMGDEEEGEDAWWPHLAPHLSSAQWRETVELFPGTLQDEGGEGRVDRLLERVIGLRGKRSDLATEARVAGILGRLLRPLEVLEYKASPALQKSYEKLLDRSLAIFEVEGARRVPIEDRLTAADALGQGGDPRLEHPRGNLLEVPGQDIRLGKYPVTVEEYQRFAEEGRGYDERRFWSEEGWKAKTEKEWTEPGSWAEQLEHPSRPMVEVSWYEAEAFCRWLSEQWGTEVRLATQEEWETAATSPEGEYPWGQAEPDTERANFDQKVSHPTPVGLYPAGNGPYGHCDLAGNVWEWCLDEVELPKIEELGWKEGELGRALRGGGWYYSASNLRSAIRLRYRAADRDGSIGFRLAAVSASTSKS